MGYAVGEVAAHGLRTTASLLLHASGQWSSHPTISLNDALKPKPEVRHMDQQSYAYRRIA
jgi:hypothetical protein